MSFSFAMPYGSGRSAVLGRNVVATSQPLAVEAGIDALRQGGNAIDAALAAAITLVVVEPTSNGLGSDAFAIVWDGTALHGLNASGRAPKAWRPERFAGLEAMPNRGWDSVSVPGAVSAWVALSERFGRLPFEALFERAIDYAQNGFPVSPIIAGQWARIAPNYQGQPGFDQTFMPGGRTPAAGDVFRFSDAADSLRAIAATKGDAFYRGDLAIALADHAAAHGGAMTVDDLAAHSADWCETVAQPFAGAALHELPPNGQGIASLIALGLLGHHELDPGDPDGADTLHLQIEAMKLALADLAAHVSDPATMKTSPRALLGKTYLKERAALIDPGKAGDFGPGDPGEGGTVYVAAADAEGRMVSFIQSNYQGFGSGVVVPGTGISLQDRGAGFTLEPGHPNEVGPGKRPLNTIIPGFVMKDGAPWMSFGVMGGPMQAQGHVQMVVRTLVHSQNPQAASDAPRWRVMQGGGVALEAGMSPKTVEGLAAKGHEISNEPLDASWAFGGAQLICRGETGYVAGSDHRKDGYAAAF
ncbi:MAG: gamma-glutamyltransferase family protein [Alphaproteobacteria bacterium]|nr:gamma-glutamyltransferase family protein [Alphaproteobacteria bacterium]